MKSIFLSVITACFTMGALQAAIFQLNNSPNSPGQYTTFAAAQTAASNGDTIMVHASPVNYGTIQISKVLTIIGPGHKPNKFPATTAEFASVQIFPNLNGIKIYGINCGGGIFSNAVGFFTNVDNLIIENVLSNGPIYIGDNCENIIIRGSILTGINMQGGNSDNIIIEHNYFMGNSPLTGFSGVGQKLVLQNMFAGAGTWVLCDAIRNTLFVNNIFYGITANTGTQTDNVYNNNLSFGHNTNNTLPPTGQGGMGNLVNVDPQFVNAQLPNQSPTPFNYARNYRLQPGSPAIGAGSAGKDIGIYTPGVDFSMTGEPLRPQTILLNLEPLTIPAGGSTNVNFTARKSTVNGQ
jgi:hypothetical protein